jgi:membrane-associated protease RseP (regulator of RpoE activity)
MSDSQTYYEQQYGFTAAQPRKNNKIILHIVLFIATFLSVGIAGTQWAGKDFTNLLNWHYGLTYAVLITTFLSAHEFGHYIASRLHKVDATLPYFIPMPIVYLNPFGTFGAVIKTRSPIANKIFMFDIGVSGPIAGFVVCFAFMVYGLMTLPGIDFIYNIHPYYLTKFGGKIPHTDLFFGDTLLYYVMAKLFANPHGFLPPMNEIYHYPFLNVGWFGMFVTSLNMLPIGQLDGGHVIYSMFGGRIQKKVSRIAWWLMIVIGIGSLLELLYEALKVDQPGGLYIFLQNSFLPILKWLKTYVPWYLSGWGGWLFWALVTRIFIKLDHPEIGGDEVLDSKRKMIGWLAIIIFIVTFSYNGIYFIP